MYPVKYISSKAFYNRSGLVKITIPDSVTQIFDYAFSGCVNLTSVVIGKSVKTINYDAFSYCPNLTSIIIPASVRTFDGAAFVGCKNLMNVTCLASEPPSIASYETCFDSECFQNAVLRVPENSIELYQKDYDWNRFKKIEPIEDSYLDNGLEYAIINEYNRTCKVCGNDYMHDNVVIPTEVSINGITYLVTSIDKYAFYYNKVITSVLIPSTIVSIGEFAFGGCDNLQSITCLPEEPPYAFVTSFPSTIYEDALLCISPGALQCYRHTSPWILFNKTIVNSGSIFEYDGLKYIISDGENKKCGVYINNNINILHSLNIPEITSVNNETYAVESIIAGAFKDCQGLKTVDFPANLKSIGADAFSGCDNILSITCRAIQPPSCEVSAFTNATYRNANLIVPYFRITSYKSTTGWDNFERYYNSSSLFQYDGLRYKILDSDAKTCEVALNIDVEGDIVIPSNAQYNDEYYTVTTIEKEAFIGAEINSVKFPESLLTIGENAFKDCGNLHEVVISENVTSIEGGAFNGCPIEVLNFDAINCLTCGNQTNPVFENTIKYIIAVR